MTYLKLTAPLLMAAALLSSGQAWANDANKIVGKWKVMNEKTGTATGIVQIKQDSRTGTYYGVAVKSLRKNRNIDMPCKQCPGRFKGKPIKQVPALWNFKYDSKKKKYKNGYVIEHASGKVYNGEIKLTKNGKSLHMRGSPLGAKFIGRTNVWIRAD